MVKLIQIIQSVLRPKPKKGVAGIWDDEHSFTAAAAETRAAGFRKFEAISPYPVHGIDEAMAIPRSWIPWVTFTFGLAGCVFGVWFTWWTSAVDWPVNIGGKPMFSLPAFIPVIFECTILFAALSSVGALFAVCRLPTVDPAIIDPDLTSHRFALFVPEDDSGFEASKVEALFKKLGAQQVKRSEF